MQKTLPAMLPPKATSPAPVALEPWNAVDPEQMGYSSRPCNSFPENRPAWQYLEAPLALTPHQRLIYFPLWTIDSWLPTYIKRG